MVSILRNIICTLSACCRIKFATHWMHARIQKTFQGRWIRRIIVFAQGIFSIILICKFNKFNKFSFFMGWGGWSGPPTSSLDPRMGWCISFVKFIFLFFLYFSFSLIWVTAFCIWLKLIFMKMTIIAWLRYVIVSDHGPHTVNRVIFATCFFPSLLCLQTVLTPCWIRLGTDILKIDNLRHLMEFVRS